MQRPERLLPQSIAPTRTAFDPAVAQSGLQVFEVVLGDCPIIANIPEWFAQLAEPDVELTNIDADTDAADSEDDSSVVYSDRSN